MAAGQSGTSSAASVAGAIGFKLGLASYSFREFGRKTMLEMTKSIGTPYINIKDFHLSMTAKPEDIAKARVAIEKAGKIIVGGGTITFDKDDQADIRKKFEYAKLSGFPLIVAAPTHVTLPKLEPFVKEYNIKIAVHNHGPEDKHFPTPDSVLEAVKGLDPRMGLCMDIGHTARTNSDIVASIKKAGPRLLDMHVKDLKQTKDTAEKKAKDSQVVVGEGVLPIREIFAALREIKFQGYVNLEYEIDDTNPLPGVLRSIAYMQGMLAGMGLKA
jgi:sugar phosphate isomerase/epimerase